jgi:hypothetical protein
MKIKIQQHFTFLKTFAGQNYNPYLNAVVFSTQEKIRPMAA